MLDMGFADDIDSILQATPDERQTVLFSATMPARINALARKYQHDPVRIQIGRSDTTPGTALVRQSAYMVQRSHKPAALGRILDIEGPKATLVFCRTRLEVDQLTETMNGRGYRAEALHGGMDQPQRDRVMGRLRDGTAELLVATDVAARGLDVDTLTHVVNYDVPSAAESYVHRIGRVGRAGRQGVAITLAEPREQRLLFNIEKLTKQKIAIERVPTVADLRARQIEQTVTAVREALASDDLDDYNDVLNALAGDHNIRTIALAAVKLAHEAGGATVDEAEIPDFSHKLDRGPRSDRPDRDGRPGERPGHKGPRSASQNHRGGTVGTGFIYVGLGRKVGIRPGDLVGLIANESNLSGREIGPIKITEQFSIVGVPEARVDDVIETLRGTMLKGKRPNARRYTD
jgi:ATP-dependent RNA helicase DeaD